MRYASHLFLRVEPELPKAIAAAARVEGIGRSEFIRRAVKQALPAGAVPDRAPRSAASMLASAAR